MAVFIAVIAGLMLGSFLSVLIGRWPHWRGAGTGRSHCPACMHDLAWYDLVPLVSWLMLRGKCRYCGAPVSAFYPTLELVMAAALGGYAYLFGLPSLWHLLDYAVLFGLVSLFFFDLKHQMLPDAIALPLGIAALARLWFIGSVGVSGALVSAAGLAALFGGLYAVSRGKWLGFGDVKLAPVMGLLFGHPVAVGVTLLAVWAGALTGLTLMGLQRASMRTALPFGSFWTAIALVTMLWDAPARAVGTLFFPLLP
jgi:leader peptidase (prepilin peptidase)/N-methyltransferase